jgi:uncharacterized membrane protein
MVCHSRPAGQESARAMHGRLRPSAVKLPLEISGKARATVIADMHPETEKRVKQTPRYLLVGVLTVAPLWVTWLVFNFVFTQLSRIGSPWVAGFARVVRRGLPGLADFLMLPGFQSALAVLLTLVLLYVIGWISSKVIGQRILTWFERVVQNIPWVAAIYGGTKRFLGAIKEKPGDVQRVVLINFPSSEMKAVGLVTRVMTDSDTGERLAAVYVPTSPNPTSGYIEIVPVKDLVPTDWSLDEAMSFVMTGGTTSPEHLRFRKPAAHDQDGDRSVREAL